MKKILVSVAAATMALSTTASALEDIKVSGQAKLFYETTNAGEFTNADSTVESRSLFDKDSSSGEVAFKIGMTGKQGDVGFGATLYHTTTMGLENDVVQGVRTNTGLNDLTLNGNDNTYLGEIYITAPIAPDTVLKFGKQELDTPMAFTERWNAAPNTFNSAVAINSSVENLTLIAAYVGQGNANQANAPFTANFASSETFSSYYGTAFALAALYKQDNFNANLWLYQINNVLGNPLLAGSGGANIGNDAGVTVNAAWFDAGMKLGDANVKAVLAYAGHDDEGKPSTLSLTDGIKGDDTFGAALSADLKVSDITLFGAVSYVNEGDIPLANTATGFKKTMLPTQGIYTDGQYVAQPGSTAVKVSAATKVGDTALSLNAVHNMNSGNDNEVMGIQYKLAHELETTEIYATVKQKVGAFDLMGIVMHRMMDDSVKNIAGKTTDDRQGGQIVRIVASVNF